MCGITGFYHFDLNKKADAVVLKKMTDVIKHRGPDGEGYHIKDSLALGHRRLSVIDLVTGDQPIYNDDKSMVIIFNGEIYNYIELRNELKNKGHQFHTESDTEVILKSYAEWGIECQKKFNGMWAFAIWDERNKILFLSRDRVGEKPLYYALVKDTFILGSEIKSILAFGVDKSPNIDILEIYLSLGYIPAPYTFYKNINKLEAGNYLIVDQKNVKQFKYWDVPRINESNMLSDSREVNEKFISLLKDSVKIRMRSDVPYGAFLSGGLDSSSVVALMSEATRQPVETFTIGFDNKAFDERKLARLVSERFHTNHHEYTVSPEAFEESLNRVLYHYDEPFGDSSAIPTGHVSRFARQYVTMVLTGDGGDEVLSGYTGYQGEKFATLYKKIPSVVRKGFAGGVKSISRMSSGGLRYKLNRIQNICQSSELDFLERRQSKIFWAEKSVVKDLTANHNVIKIEDYLNDFYSDCPYKDNFYKVMYFNLKISLPDDYLVKVDRMSMAYSLETRTPFLDYRLIEFMVNVDKNIKMQGYERKSVLKRTIGKQLPPLLLKAGKKGFSIPLREWLKDKCFEDRLESLCQTESILNRKAIKSLINDNRTGKKDYGNFIWMLFVLNKWFDKNA
jgi:asparagine synthase (glutamine-hydrolysing)